MFTRDHDGVMHRSEWTLKNYSNYSKFASQPLVTDIIKGAQPLKAHDHTNVLNLSSLKKLVSEECNNLKGNITLAMYNDTMEGWHSSLSRSKMII